ncbi:hypothetical protein [Methylobacterium sp. JK268]
MVLSVLTVSFFAPTVAPAGPVFGTELDIDPVGPDAPVDPGRGPVALTPDPPGPVDPEAPEGPETPFAAKLAAAACPVFPLVPLDAAAPVTPAAPALGGSETDEDGFAEEEPAEEEPAGEELADVGPVEVALAEVALAETELAGDVDAAGAGVGLVAAGPAPRPGFGDSGGCGDSGGFGAAAAGPEAGFGGSAGLAAGPDGPFPGVSATRVALRSMIGPSDGLGPRPPGRLRDSGLSLSDGVTAEDPHD